MSQINIFINGNKLKQRDQFKYLGALISSDGCNNTEIDLRIAQTKKKFPENKISTKKIKTSKKEEPYNIILNPFCCMDARTGQFQNNNWRQQKYGSYIEHYKPHARAKKCKKKTML